MSGAERSVADAEEQVRRTRERLTLTAGALRSRLAPAALASGAVEGTKGALGKAAVATVGQVKRKPLIAIGAAVALGAFVARRPLLRLIRGKPDRR